jgi:RNA polymerase sigma-70 factor (ECF subfamily)
MTDDFATLLDAARAGGEWAMTRLYRSVDPSLRRYLQAQLGPEAEDVASETWLSVARNLQTFDGDEDAFRAWVFTIGKRRVVDHHRARSRRPTAPDPDLVPSAEDEALSGDEAAARIVALLPQEQAQIVLLRVVAGFSVEEVAEIVGRRPGTVRVMQHRALKRLAEKLGDEV